MKRKCIGCGNIFEGGIDALCPRSVGKGQSCGCLSEPIEEVKKEIKSAAKAGGKDGGN